MRRSIFALLGATALVAGAAFYAQTHAQTSGKASVNVGSLVCTASDGTGLVFGSTRDVDCLFARADGVAEPYRGAIKRFGSDTGFNSRAHMVWLVFASGAVAPGALAGDFGKVTGPVPGLDRPKGPLLIDGSNRHIALEPAHVPGNAGLNVAEGVAEVTLQHGT